MKLDKTQKLMLKRRNVFQKIRLLLHWWNIYRKFKHQNCYICRDRKNCAKKEDMGHTGC